MTLYLWKAPVTDDPDEAERLLQPFESHGDESAFEPSADLVAVANELLRQFPDAEDGPWADSAPEPSERLLLLSIRWGADDAVTDAITKLARDHELVLYDPQGPDVGIVRDPIEPGPTPPPSVKDHLWFVLMGLAAAGVFALGWWIDVPVLDWILMIAGGFFFSVIVFLLYILLFESKNDTAGGGA
jgi:hypothetical protein